MPSDTVDDTHTDDEGNPPKLLPYIDKIKLYELDLPNFDLSNANLVCEGQGIQGFFEVIRVLAALPTDTYRYRLYFELSDGNEIDILPRTQHSGNTKGERNNYQMLITSWFPLQHS